MPEQPLPDTAERLRAFKTASTAIHGSLLMAALLYQDSVKAKAGEGGLRRALTAEGVGLLQPGSTFNVVQAAYKVFDPEGKGHISADDLRKGCAMLGYTVDDRDIDNMLSVLAPSSPGEEVRALANPTSQWPVPPISPVHRSNAFSLPILSYSPSLLSILTPA